MSELERLQKIIARAGFASRREAEQMIEAGRVTVNGRVITELGTKANPLTDHVKVDGKLITKPETHRYILLNKPKEIMTTVKDPEGRKTVMDLIRGVKERIFPVGRLDYHSEGLILLTNDGELAFKVSHPTQGSVKTYHVKVRGVPEDRILDKLRRGITLDGKRTRPADIERMRTTGRSDDEGNSWFQVKLREGMTQQIRKMFKVVGHPVMKLRRVAIGAVSDPKLLAGQWRELTRSEIKQLSAPAEERKERKPRGTAKRPAARRKTSAAPKGRATKSAPRKPAAKGGKSRSAARRS